jgi:hypothetical protein
VPDGAEIALIALGVVLAAAVLTAAGIRPGRPTERDKPVGTGPYEKISER